LHPCSDWVAWLAAAVLAAAASAAGLAVLAAAAPVVTLADARVAVALAGPVELVAPVAQTVDARAAQLAAPVEVVDHDYRKHECCRRDED
jgi:hypothetical protein